jgi:hypothetical protein
MKTKRFLFIPLVLILLVSGVLAANGQGWVAVKDDPLVRMPGTQPGQVSSLESPNRCFNCHAGYNHQVEPGFNWRGSMMAQASRDFLFWACLTVSAQDSIAVLGNPNAVDLCERCHFPAGWLDGRSDPPNASAMKGSDFDGVSCDFCHNMYDPHFEDTHKGLRETADWKGYWDETNLSSTPSQTAANTTYNADKALAGAIKLFNNNPFFTSNYPPPNYTEAASGQFFIGSGEKRASFADATGRHKQYYSRFHKSKYFCAACHDVSNPALANMLLPTDEQGRLPSEALAANSYFHVERTFSEFMLSAYGRSDSGSEGIGPFAPDKFATSNPGNYIAMCQDCHMRDVTGRAANKNDAILRPTGSIEHPQSGQPLHDLTGGNIWVSYVLASAVSGSPVYNATNSALLNQGANVLTLDLNQGMGVDPYALLAGVERAKEQLNLAAAINDIAYDANSGALSFQVQNQTGHKLISGFPEGRRMFINVKAYQNGALVYEINPYDKSYGTLKGMPGTTLTSGEMYVDELVYEMKPSSTITGETEGTFHFVLATGRYKDNRIPPKGFDIGSAAARLSQPVWEGDNYPDYFTNDEYTGGYDEVNLTMPTGADRVEVNLYYQVTSREYIQFLADQINGNATTLTKNYPNAYIAQTDPFFAKLKAWGNTIWSLWANNKDLPGAAPYLMTSAEWEGQPACTMPAAPQNLAAVSGNKQVSLSWSEVTGSSYNVYYDQSGKSQEVAKGLETTSYTDSNLTNGQTYCYKVTAVNTCGESAYSTVACATASNQGSAAAGVTVIETGYYVKSGKTTTFTPTNEFKQGDSIVFRATVKDASGNPVSSAKVDLLISGGSTVQIVTNPSNAEGIAEVTWSTSAPNKKGVGGTPTGGYTVEAVNVTATGYIWDGVGTRTEFALN